MPGLKLFGETGLHKLYKLVNRFLFIGTGSDNADSGITHNAQGENTEEALGVNLALILFNPDG